MRLRVHTVALLAALACGMGAVQAAPATTSEVETLVKRGNELRKQGNDHEALPLFQRAYETAGTARTAAQLGLCEMQLGYWLAADEHLREALAGPRDTWLDRYRPVLQESLDKVKQRLGELSITGTPPGAMVTINGRSAGKLPLPPTRVVAGPVRVEIASVQHKAWSRTVDVPGGGALPVTAHLELLDPPKPPRPKDEAEPGWPTGKVVGASLIGAGVLSVGGGVTLLALDKRQTCAVQMPGDQCAERTRTVVPGWTLVGAGVAPGILGAIVFARAGKDVAVSVGPSGVELSGRF